MIKRFGVLFITFAFLVGSQAFAAGGSSTGAAGSSTESPGTVESSPGAGGASDQQSSQMTRDSQSAMGMSMSHRASELIGHQVRTSQGEDLGNVEDIIFNDDGQVQYVILSRGGLLGIGATLIPVPFDSADFSFERDSIVAHNLNAQMLEGAPTLSDGEWDRLTDPTFERDVRGYYEQGALRDLSPAPTQESPSGMSPAPGTDSPGTVTPGQESPGAGNGAGAGSGTTSPEGSQSR